MDNELLKTRVKGKVTFHFFCAKELVYQCEDQFHFRVPVADTVNDQGAQPMFLAEEKGIYMMRWIRKEMENA